MSGREGWRENEEKRGKKSGATLEGAGGSEGEWGKKRDDRNASETGRGNVKKKKDGDQRRARERERRARITNRKSESEREGEREKENGARRRTRSRGKWKLVSERWDGRRSAVDAPRSVPPREDRSREEVSAERNEGREAQRRGRKRNEARICSRRAPH